MNVTELLDLTRKVYLNDSSAVTYTDVKLIPHLKTAYDDMETSLEANDIQVKNEIAPVKTITAGILEYTPLPSDYMWPVKLEERLAGSTDLYIPMTKREWEPQEKQADRLKYWVDRHDKILFIGSITDREVLLYYQRTFPAISSGSDLLIGKAELYLYAKTAALALLFIGQNETLAKAANAIAEANLKNIINIQVKKRQALPTRRKPFRAFR